MTICNGIVHAESGRGAPVAARLAALPGVEVHGGMEDDSLLVTLEDAADDWGGHAPIVDVLAELSLIPGVVHVALVYRYGEADGRADRFASSRGYRRIATAPAKGGARQQQSRSLA